MVTLKKAIASKKSNASPSVVHHSPFFVPLFALVSAWSVEQKFNKLIDINYVFICMCLAAAYSLRSSTFFNRVETRVNMLKSMHVSRLSDVCAIELQWWYTRHRHSSGNAAIEKGIKTVVFLSGVVARPSVCVCACVWKEKIVICIRMAWAKKEANRA